MRILIALFDRIGKDVLYEPYDAQTHDCVNYHISEFKKLWEGDYDIMYHCDIDDNKLQFTVKFNNEYDRTMLLLKWA